MNPLSFYSRIKDQPPLRFFRRNYWATRRSILRMNSYLTKIPSRGMRRYHRSLRSLRSAYEVGRRTAVRYPRRGPRLLRNIKDSFWFSRKCYLKSKHKLYWSIRAAIMGVIRKAKRSYWTFRKVVLQLRNTMRRRVQYGLARFSWLTNRKKPFLPTQPGQRSSAKQGGNGGLVQEINGLGVAKASFEKRAKKYQQFAEHALAIAKELEIDVVHAHDLNAAIAAKQIHDQLQVPYVYDSHELWTQRNSPNIQVCEEEKTWEKEQEGQVLRNASFSITVCDSIADHLSRMYVAKRPIVLRNTPMRPNTPIDASKDLRNYYRIGKGDFLAVYVGKIAANRGIIDILDALPMTKPQVKVALLGPFDPKFREVFDQKVLDNHLVGRVFWHDAVPGEEIHSWISKCDLSLTTMNQSCLSYVYALPNKLFESIQAGLPVLGPNSPEIIRILESYRCGTNYQDGDAEDLAQKLNTLMEQPGLLSQYRKGSEKAAGELCWEIERERLLSAYEQHFSVDSLPSLIPSRQLPQTAEAAGR